MMRVLHTLAVLRIQNIKLLQRLESAETAATLKQILEIYAKRCCVNAVSLPSTILTCIFSLPRHRFLQIGACQ